MMGDLVPDAGRRSSSFRSIDRQRACAILVAALALTLASPGLAEPFGQGFVEEVEPNATSIAATPLGGTNVVGQGQIVNYQDVDFWSFPATAGDRVHVAVVTSSSAQSTNSVLELIAPDGTTVLESDDDDGSFASNSSSIAGAIVASTGTHYLRIAYKSPPGTSNEIRPYRLYLRVQSGAPDEEFEVNDVEPQELLAAGWVEGSLGAGDKDLYSLDLAAGETLFVSLDADPERDGGTTYDPRLGVGLFGASGTTQLVDDDDNTTSPNSEAIVATVLSAGTYQIYVDEDSGAGGPGYTYRLSVSVLPATEQGVACTTYTSTDVSKAIPTGPGSTTSTLDVPGQPRIADLDLILQLNHASPADLDLHLVSPAGNDNAVVTDVGNATFPDWDLAFDDESAAPAGSYPIADLEGLGLQPEREFRLDWFDGEDAGGTWTLVVTDDAASNGGTLTGWSLRICEPAELPACPEGTTRQSVLTTDFEGGSAGFTHAGTLDEWQLGSPSGAPIDDCASGAACWDTDLGGSYNNSSSQTLYSPAINLAGASGPVVVSWAQKYQMENATFDHFDVELGIADLPAGATQTLFDWRGPDMRTTIGSTSTTLQESAGWGIVSKVADSGFLGEIVELRFHLDSDSISGVYDGAAIDDVDVTACFPESGPTALFADGFASGKTCAWSSATGSPDSCP